MVTLWPHKKKGWLILPRREEETDGIFCCDKKLARAEVRIKKLSYAA